MYTPSSFAVTDLPHLHAYVRQHSFGILITQTAGESQATHLPMLLDGQSQTQGVLVGHLARANSQWKQPDSDQALAIFPGPHVYVSPAWYQAPNVVPTWNYVAVHAYGRLQWIDDPSTLREIVQRSVEVYERPREQPWEFAGDPDYLDKLLTQVVGFRLQVERWEGKWKLSQNQPLERQQKVLQALQQQPDENSQAIAQLMRANLGPVPNAH